jgi:hypothetical protein|tara:strand:- start:455 stop:1603 length:1149 start_codon:yes stop_codon:yes gene_type:complete
MAKRKIKTVRSTKKSRMTIDEMHYGPEPVGADWFEQDGNSLNSYFSWYNYFYDRNRVNQIIVGYAKEHGYKNAMKFKKLYIPGTIAAMIRGLETGMVFPDHKDYPGEGTAGHQKHIHKELRAYNKKAIAMKIEDIDTGVVVKKRKTVQENIEAKVVELLGEVDYAIDVWDCEKFDMYKYLTDNKVSSAVALKIPAQYKDMRDEMKEAIEGKDEQLKEAYNFMNKSEKKGFLNFVNKIVLDTERYAENNKPIRKPRKAKAISAVNQVKDLNFLEQDVEHQVKSIDPSKIIGAKQLWLFNNKTNEIIKYDQIDRGGLAVKGTTIKNFDEKSSGSKKLGVKTEDVIDRVLEGGTITLNKVMSEINSKVSKVTGRINNNMIILKVD